MTIDVKILLFLVTRYLPQLFSGGSVFFVNPKEKNVFSGRKYTFLSTLYFGVGYSVFYFILSVIPLPPVIFSMILSHCLSFSLYALLSLSLISPLRHDFLSSPLSPPVCRSPPSTEVQRVPPSLDLFDEESVSRRVNRTLLDLPGKNYTIQSKR